VASDGMFESNEATVNFWVWEVNDPPVPQDLVVVEGGGGTVTGQLVVADAEGDWFYYAVTTEPAHGTVTIDPESGTFTYMPGPDSTGYDSFTYTAYDWQGGGTTATVQIVSVPSPPPDN
jgi:VCBS repeat-containing protein